MSGLSTSMWTGVSGLLSHTKNMNVIGNNLANVSTLGFKSQRMDFNDYLYLSGTSASGTTQLGAGSSVYTVLGDFSQGAFETTNSATDIAIDGNGFFGVRKQNSEQIFYTRAGDFYFNESRELINPQGMCLQGWRVDNEFKNTLTFKSDGASGNKNKDVKVESPFVGQGTPKDIILDNWNCIPQRTSSIKNIVGFIDDAEMYDKTPETIIGNKTVNSTLGLFYNWNGSDPENIAPLADTAAAYQSTITVYDEGGKTHDLTIYYDQVNPNAIANVPDGYKIYEYIVTMDPSEDMRTGFAGTLAAGMLMTGVLVFNASGELVNQSAYTYNGNGAGTDLDKYFKSWSPTKFSNNGLPTFTANWNGINGADHVWDSYDSNGDGTPDSNALAQKNVIELDLGLTVGGDWFIIGDGTGTSGVVFPHGGNSITPPNKTLHDMDINNPHMVDYNSLCLMENPIKQDIAASCNGTNSIVEHFKSQNGYGSGILTSYKIDTNGVVYGIYDNNQSVALYQISMYDFDNYQGLRREGGNLYGESFESGQPRIGVAGDNGFGETIAYNIEVSNVDMTTELVRMISCQRGFQSNSKIITTVDTMLETVIGMKR